MSSRNMCVILLSVLTIGAALPAVVALAQQPAAQTQQPQDAQQSQAKSDATPPPQDAPAPTTALGPSTGRSSTVPVPPVPSKNAPPAQMAPRGGYGVMVGPNGQVQTFGEGDVFGGGGGATGGFQGPGPGSKEYARAMEQIQRAQEQLRNLQGSFNVRGRPFFGPPDPETQALEEKEDKIDQEVHKDVNQYKSATDQAAKASLKKQVSDLAGQQFDIRQQARELEVKRLEAELARIRESIKKRNDNREQIIKHHVAQLLHEEDDLEF